jgi:hypothetical protein
VLPVRVSSPGIVELAVEAAAVELPEALNVDSESGVALDDDPGPGTSFFVV